MVRYPTSTPYRSVMNMLHKHHIVPKHMGGTDDPSNLVEVTVEQHAELHFALYLEHGKKEDWCAAMGLAGYIGKEEAIRIMMDPTGRKHSEETKLKMSESAKGRKMTDQAKAKVSAARKGKKLSPEHRAKISASLVGNTRWINQKRNEKGQYIKQDDSFNTNTK